MNGLSVIVPLLDEIATLPNLVASLDLIGAEQLIIVDGGSVDGSSQWLAEHWLCDDQTQASRMVLTGSVGRAQQMNLGAEHATQSMLLFLHADTQLPSNAKSLICDYPNGETTSNGKTSSEHNWGRFDVRFDSNSNEMGVIAFFMNVRSRISGVATGDHAIFVHRELFDSVGAFDNLSLMEDVAISKKLRVLSTPRCLSQKVVTSARRWEENGIIFTMISMWWYRLLFFLGVSPDKFVRKYRDIR